METPSQLLQGCVVHAVIISANALLCLALYNRLTAVLSRLRAMNQERFELSAKTTSIEVQRQCPGHLDKLRRRTEALDQQVALLYRRAALIRTSLVWLLVTVQCMIACSLALGLATLGGLTGTICSWAAVALFVAGMAVMMLGVGRAIQDLLITLDALQFEQEIDEPPATEGN